MKPEKIDGETLITMAGIEWTAHFEATLDDDIIEEIVYVEIAPKDRTLNDGWEGDRITVVFGELPESVQDEIEAASYRALNEYIASCADNKYGRYGDEL